jgi:hypothetical protein
MPEKELTVWIGDWDAVCRGVESIFQRCLMIVGT